MKLFLFFLTIIGASSVRAHFYTPETLPQAPAGFVAAFAAAIRMDFDSDNWCSGVTISNDGYVMTNLHCLRTCFYNADGLFDDYVQLKEGASYNVWKIKHRDGNKAICRPYYSSTQRALGTDEPEIVWLGKGRGAFDDAKITEIPIGDYKKLKSLSYDYAILKFNSLSTDIPCIRLSQQKAQVDEPVWSIGYPSKTTRTEGNNSDGQNKFISMGKVLKGIEQDPILQSIYTTDLQWELEAGIFNQPHILLSSLDSVGGSSGSVIVNKQGEMVGLLSARINPDTAVDRHGTVIAMRASHVYKDIVHGLGQSKADEIFNCEK